MTRKLAALMAVALLASGCKREERGENAITKETHTAFFPLTGSHEPYDCVDCHGLQQGSQSFTEFTCTSCHEHSKELMNDRHHGKVLGYEFDPMSCYSCHVKSEPIGINHEALLPIRPGSSHAGLTCDTCHLSNDDWKRVDCISCHDHAPEISQTQHVNVPDYVYSTQGCLDCHPGSKIDLLTVNHEDEFPIAPGTKHAGFGCNVCHTTPGDRTQYSCTGCHTHSPALTTLTHFRTGLTFPENTDGKLCYACHAKSQVDVVNLPPPPVPPHPNFPIGAGTAHANVSCLFCHTEPGNYGKHSCATGCHATKEMFLKHTEVAGHEYTTPACLKCHGDSQINRVVDHPVFEIFSGSPHFLSACLSCHPAARLDKPRAADFAKAKIACAPCHSRSDMAAAHINIPYDFDTPLTCLTAGVCHPDGRVQLQK